MYLKSLLKCCGRRKKVGDSKNQVDQELKLAALKEKLNLKILILGAGESGKSTVIKQVKAVNKINPSPQEINDVINALRNNAISSMLILIQQAETYQYEYETEEAKEFAKYISALDVEESEELDPKVTKAIETLWKDNAIKQTFERKTEYWILEASDYYFDNFARFMEDDFVPTEEDIVMARVMTVGITTTEVSVPPCQVTLVDVGGQRNERRKWIHCFDNVNAIIFVVNLAGYNMVLFEDPTQNRMKECFNLFKQTVNNEVFANTPLYLLFNKKDLFEKKIRKDPITVCECFKDYKGTGEIKDALDYIDDLFRSQITAGDSKRLTVFHVAARYKRDIKTCWDDIINDIKSQNKKDIEAALNALGKTDP